MIIRLEKLMYGIQGIYKLNYPNGKIYIGQSCDIKRRMQEHNSLKRLKSRSNQQPCDLAIQKYGKFDEIEILEIIKDSKILDEREQYWISYYNSANKEIGYNLTPGGKSIIGEKNPKSKLQDEEVLDIRKRRYSGERKKDVYLSYQDKISFSGFENIWLGRGYTNIGKEFFIPTNTISRQEYSSYANSGEKNGRSKITEKDVKNIRKRYANGDRPSDIAKDYPNVKYVTINRICKKLTWKNVE